MAAVEEKLQMNGETLRLSFAAWKSDPQHDLGSSAGSLVSNISVEDLGMELEIVFRQSMERFLEKDGQSLTLESDSVAFVRFSVEFANSIIQQCPAFGKVPFQLIDDLLEDKNISQAKALWPLLESLAEKLTAESLFSKGKFIMLKTCNFLLKKLSKSSDTEFCGRVLLFLAAIYPISEKSAVNLAGKINTGNKTYFDDLATYEINTQSSGDKATPVAAEEGESTEDFQVTYQLYESFWKLQTMFASDLRGFDSTNPSWQEFMATARSVIDLLTNASRSTDAVSTPSSGDSAFSDRSGSVDYLGTKYLTSSQLFILQLRDPMLRQQVAVQLLLFAHYLRTKAIPGITSVEQRVSFLKDIVFIHDNARVLIQSSMSVHSAKLVQIVQRMLDREENWIRWKNGGCPPFERPPQPARPKLKRSLEQSGLSVEASAKRSVKKAADYVFDCSVGNIRRIMSQQQRSAVDLEEKIQEYLDADDPENGIEEEYHPKHDRMFCWRVRRLLAEKDIFLFRGMVDGDLGKILRKYKHLPEPEPKQESVQEMVMTEVEEADNAVMEDIAIPSREAAECAPVAAEEGETITADNGTEDIEDGAVQDTEGPAADQMEVDGGVEEEGEASATEGVN